VYVWYVATVRQIEFSKESYLDHSTHLGSPLSTYPPHFVTISLAVAQICPEYEIQTGPLVAEFYFRFQFWQVSAFGDLPVYDPTKFQENRSTRGWVLCDSAFSIPNFIPTLSTAQRHSAVTQAAYSSWGEIIPSHFATFGGQRSPTFSQLKRHDNRSSCLWVGKLLSCRRC